jgi:hypothetical protein
MGRSRASKANAMDTNAQAARLTRRARARQAAAETPVVDFADLGTAFGLDQSLAPLTEEADAAARPATARDAGFWRRLAQRRSGAR